MSEDDRTPAWKRFDEVLDGIVAEAVEAERAKCKKAVADAISEIYAKRDPAMPMWRALEACRDAIEQLPPEPEPPAPEPMTIAELIAKLRRIDCGLLELWRLEQDLTRLEQSNWKAQARRDAEIVAKSSYMGGTVLAHAILKEAGLE